MPSYSVTSELAGHSRKPVRVLLRAGSFVLLSAGCLIAFQIPGWIISPFGIHSRPLWDIAVGAICIGVGAALGYEFRFDKGYLPYTLVVSDDRITAVHASYEKSLRKDEIKTVTEIKSNGFCSNVFYGGALRVSKHGRFGTRLFGIGRWGSILIPKSLPQYESVRDLVLSWKVPTRA